MNRCGADAVGVRQAGNRRSGRIAAALLLLAGALALLVQPALAAGPRGRAAKPAATQAEPRTKALAGPTTPSWIVISASTGEELSSQEPDRPGRSGLHDEDDVGAAGDGGGEGRATHLTDPVPTSRLASKMGGSQVYLKQGEIFLGGGDAGGLAHRLRQRRGPGPGGALTGSVEATIQRMNDRAVALKLTHTKFGSVHGLPPGPGQEGDVTTPRDMARLGQELLKYPDVLRWTGKAEAPFRGGRFILRNSNKLVGSVSGVDGIKTGHFREAGYNVAVTAKRGNHPADRGGDGRSHEPGALHRGGATDGRGVQPLRRGERDQGRRPGRNGYPDPSSSGAVPTAGRERRPDPGPARRQGRDQDQLGDPAQPQPRRWRRARPSGR